MAEALDLGPIEGRYQSANATAELMLVLGPRIGTAKAMKEAAMAAARSAADVPALVAEIKRLRNGPDA